MSSERLAALELEHRLAACEREATMGQYYRQMVDGILGAHAALSKRLDEAEAELAALRELEDAARDALDEDNHDEDRAASLDEARGQLVKLDKLRADQGRK